jgi:AcrR family transcriptional regulator
MRLAGGSMTTAFLERRQNMASARKAAAGETLWDEIAGIKKERILKEAADLFFERGYMQTTVDAIAERVGATKPFIYSHFKSKIDLLSEICERTNQDALAAAKMAASQKVGAVEQLSLFVREFTDVVLAQHHQVAIYFREQIHLPPTDAGRITILRKQIDKTLQEILIRGKKEGQFEFDDLSMCSLVIAGMLSYAFAWYREGGRLANDQIREQMLVYVLRVVRAVG